MNTKFFREYARRAFKQHLTAAKVIFVTAIMAITGSVSSAQHDLSDTPLFTLAGVDPNIVLTMDDSGSMAWSFMPTSVGDYPSTKRAKSAAFNKIYYDPTVLYEPPVDENGNSLGNASFTAAWDNGFNKSGSGSCTKNLSTSYRPSWGGINQTHCGSSNYSDGFYNRYATSSSEAAYYYLFDDSLSGCNGNTTDDDCYKKIVVSDTSGTGDTVDERENFANWYSYYRKRVFVTKTAATLAFERFNSNIRVGYQRINNSTLTGVQTFSGTRRNNFFDWLHNLPANGGTPLLKALDKVGEYFETTAPYRDDPSDGTSTERSCRQNFHIMMTDGEWNSGSPSGFGNVDNSSQTIPANDYGITTYSPRAPYRDGNSTYLGDIAFNYWFKDLRPSAENNVPVNVSDLSTDIDGDGDTDNNDIFWNPINDPANWQHMVNFMIGLGVSGERDFPNDYDELLDGTLSWPSASGGNDQAKIDDLWHASINSRGEYLSAQNPEQLVSAFTDVINSVLDRTGSFATAALNSGTISSDTALFFARFTTNDWTGNLIAQPISDGTNCGPVALGNICPSAWDAACGLTGGFCPELGKRVGKTRPNNRIIITRNDDDNPIPFRWASLKSGGAQRASLNQSDSLGSKRLNYLRGARGQEVAKGKGGIFRNRKSVLGDIISSIPTYVGPPGRFYFSSTDFPEGASYASFKTAYKNRDPMVYVGSNNGMLHGFKTVNGRESLAYVPASLFSNLWELTKADYSHRNYVDGPISENDVYYNGAWHSLLVSGLGTGGQGYFALDITDPAAFTEANAASISRWEFTDSDDADLGYSFSKPSMVRLANGKWGVIVGNGLNSTESDGNASSTGNGVIFILDAQTGALIKKLDTKQGSADDPEGLSRPNGIIGTSVVDENGDFIADRLYAGDLFGNVWAFDISDSNTGQWASHYGSSSNPQPLFSAEVSSVAQPITSNLKVKNHPTSEGFLVYFGTGKYLGKSDLTDTRQQTFYAIWDRKGNNTNGFSRARLLEQTVTAHSTASTDLRARVVSKTPIQWDNGSSPVEATEKLGWYIDLPETGERVHQAPTLRDGRVIFVTVTPANDPCAGEGTSWLMEVDAFNGGRLDESVFDFNKDRTFNSADMINVGDIDGDGEDNYVHGSGIQRKNAGILSRPGIINHPDGRTESKYVTTSKGKVESILEDSGRNRQTPWREIR
ncbi:MAG: PilC/PilY family type IV pilus protein [Porticoccaceae bacterium]|nr:PilC/PilY family type IV pilus protein [Porticoccaceae bacterium]